MDLELLKVEEIERVLVVVAHPDDAEYGLSVAVNSFTAAGKEVGYLLLTAGEAGIRDMEPAKTKALRAHEQRAACQEVGVEHLTILDFPDGEMEYGLDVRKAVAKEIREFQPDTVAVINFDFSARWGLTILTTAWPVKWSPMPSAMLITLGPPRPGRRAVEG